MITEDDFIQLALALPNTQQTIHFDRIGLKVTGKRMFASYLAAHNTANIFLTPEQQVAYCGMDSDHIYPVPNKWGQKGATTFELDMVEIAILREALLTAYRNVIPGAK